VFSGPDIESMSSASSAFATYTGSDDYQLGIGMGTDTDLDSDGVDDLIMYGVNSWNVYNYLGIEYGGGTGGAVSWSGIDATFRLQCGTSSGGGTAPYCGGSSGGGSQGGTETWAYMAHEGSDLDGDGYHDLVLADQYNDDVANQAGKVWILWGKSTQYANSNGGLGGVSTNVAAGSSVGQNVGGIGAPLPDADGDGDNELIINDGDAEETYFFAGGTSLRSGTLDLTGDSDATFTMGSDDVTAVANAGDWTGDGIADWALAFGDDNGVSFYESRMWSGSFDIGNDISGSIVGGDDNDTFGWGMAERAIDMNGDSREDVAIGDYQYADESSGDILGMVGLFYQN
jgi:hypothetical protein